VSITSERIEKLKERARVAAHNHDDRYPLRSELDADEAALAAHAVDTTNVHGITDTTALALTANLKNQLLRDGGTDKTARGKVNFVDTAQIAFTLADDAANDETEVSAAFVADMATQADLDSHKTSTDHDGRYYTEAEVDALIAALPKGELGYAEVTANQTTITAVTDITGLSVTYTPAANRRIRVNAYCFATVSTVGTDRGEVYITDGAGTVLQSSDKRFSGTNGESGFSFSYTYDSGAAPAATTRKVRYARLSGTGSHTWGAAATAPSFIQVEDIGAS
jgi:hypothetical protein